jgi:hypothetical protein
MELIVCVVCNALSSGENTERTLVFPIFEAGPIWKKQGTGFTAADQLGTAVWRKIRASSTNFLGPCKIKFLMIRSHSPFEM